MNSPGKSRADSSALKRPVAVDLFSGAGGMSLAFEQAGFDVVCAVEFDPAHAAAHRFNFPLCEVIEADACGLGQDRLRAAVEAGLRRHGRDPGEPVDAVFGGPPCQGFSVGGLRDPEDPRNRLVEEFARMVADLGPSAWVLENVPAMARRSLPGEPSQMVVEWIQERLRGDGYEIAASGVLNAAHFGVPQDRRRLIVLGARDGVEASLPAPRTATLPRFPGAPLRPGDLGHRDTLRALPACPSVADALADLPDLSRYAELWGSDVVAIEKDEREELGRRASAYARELRGDSTDAGDLSWPRRRSPSRLSASMRTAHGPEVVERFAATAPGEREQVSRFIRLHPQGVSPTLRAGTAPDRGSYSAPRPIHPEHDRVISVREAARLHGFPDWFRPTAAKWHGFRQVGNAVPPPLGRAVAEAVREAFDWLPEQPTVAEGRLALGDPALLQVANGGGRSAAKRAMEEREAAKSEPLAT
jgi:DNA (cytosine-5)-methyltransferase 1